MGYNTFVSLPGKGDLNPLKNRLNIVITNSHYIVLSSKISEEDEILLYKTYDDFYKDITENGIPQKFTKYKNDEIFVIGGGSLYDYVYDNFKVNAIYETLTNISISIPEYSNKNKITYFNRFIDRDRFLKVYKKEGSAEITLNGGKDNENKIINGDYTINFYQDKRTVNKQELEYLNLIKEIYMNGDFKDSRNSKVISMLLHIIMNLDLRERLKILLTTKKGSGKRSSENYYGL